MASLEQVKFVTEQYYELHGLRWVLWGVVCFTIALETVGLMPTVWTLAVVLPGAFVSFLGISWFYVRRYGVVIGAKRSYGPSVWSLLTVPALIVGLLIDKWLGTRPFVMPMVFAAWFIVQFWMVGRQWRKHYLWIAVAIVAVNLVTGFMHWPAGSYMLEGSFVTWMLAGAAMIVGGLFDHALIARTLGGKVAEDVGTV